ncbi:ATP-binding protein [Desulfoferrobacter suflitae]|uniref:ATP-binding protein n=1 Tax=Desulfoferrobacter suflitae TaxID=2865782 RepID=UPI0021641CBA|nr:ATP-binding protein [Desulfoferrobacter suflitae]MCK8601529.1 ATP-binding protein [Desulfoferrobacter suflitae]
MTWSRISLRAKIWILLTALVLTALVGGSVTMLLIYRIGVLTSSVVDRDVVALDNAQELETALVMQKGLLTYYFLDGNSEWLKQLEARRVAFEELLNRARETSYTATQRDILNQIESKYIRYSYLRDQVISLYNAGKREAGYSLHQEIRPQFFAIRDLTDLYKEAHARRINEARAELKSQVTVINSLALVAMPAALLIGLFLAYILMKQVLQPIRQLAMATDPASDAHLDSDEIQALSQRVHDLIQDVDQTQTQLKWSHQHLLQSERLAQVGKLAAGVAHSIRNPLTSVKMRLFSLERTLRLSLSQKEDFEVISEEIRHIDTIVRNFLEFSRPPKLKMQSVSPSDAVDMALQLLRHRLESYGVDVELVRARRLPEISADPEQLKEVLVNLLVNACEVMNDGGSIVIEERERTTEEMGRVLTIKVADSGPGIPESVKDKIFEPFFSTKEEGTGLGLSIASRIVGEHGGKLQVQTQEGEGTTFVITLPFP